MENKNSYPILKGQKVLKYFFTCNLIALSLFVPAPSVQANTYVLAQSYSLNLSFKNERLSTVLDEISRQSGIKIAYSNAQISANSRISVKVKTSNIEDALRVILGENYSYKQVEDYISITKNSQNNEFIKSEEKKIDKITGVITDANGESLIGATVTIKNLNQGVITDIDGRYEIEIPSNKAILIYSYLGYISEEVEVKDKRNINVILREDAKNLEEVVVIGYGSQRKSSIVSSISSVKPASISVPTRNLSGSLAGQVSGLIAVQRSGEPGYDDAEFWIRGVSTFAGGTSPLVLVDGVPRKMNDIEPDEIETFSVLKDAAATAVYGAEGANGVVLITTKRGKNTKAQITFKTEHSFSQPTRLPEFVGSVDYMNLFNEAMKNDGESPQFSEELIDKYRQNLDPDLYPNSNWINELLKKTTTNHRYTLNVRGGTDRAKYFVSGAYFKESGLFKGNPTEIYDTNIGVERFNLRSNIDIDISKTTAVTVDLAGQYMITNFPGTGTSGIFRSMLITPPHSFPAVYSDGTVATFDQERDSNMRNPYNLLMNSGYAKEFRTGMQTKVSLNQKLDFITNGLSLIGNISYDYDGTYISRRAYNPSRFHATGRDESGDLIFNKVVSGSPILGDPTQSSSSIKRIYMDAALNYKKIIKDHTISGMMLFMQKEVHEHGNALPFRKQGLVGRVNYSYADKYFIEANFGYTGSETFAKGNRFGFFPAVGIAYYLSNESFYSERMKEILPKAKLRVSVGKTGNDNTGGDRFLYRPTFNMGAGGWNQGIGPDGGLNGLGDGIQEQRFAAPYLSWEIENKQNYGFDLGFWDNRIELIADYFKSERSGILLQRKTIPSLGGFRTNPWENFGKVSNQGVDASLNINHQIGDLKLGARSTFTYSRNKVLEYDELPQKYPWMNVTGTRVNENTLYIADGLYTEDNFIVSNNTNGTKNYQLKPELPSSTLGGLLAPGDIKYKDVNGDGVIDNFDKVRGVGNSSVPEIVYGFGLNAEYKGFYASIFFQGTGNCSVILGGNTSEGWYPFAWGVDQSNYRTFALDRWTEENPSQNVLMPRLHKSGANNRNNTVPSTWWLRDGSFIRLKNIEFGYQIPKKFLSKINIETARIYVMGYNLAVWDDIEYFDPEAGNTNGGLNYPLPRTGSIGLSFTF